MTLYAALIYDDGRSTSRVEIDFPEEDGSGLVTIPSIENAMVDAVEVTDETGRLICTTYVGMFLRVTDALQITVVPPESGWPATTATAYFLKEAEEVAVVQMREKLQAMADRLHAHQQPLWVGDVTRKTDWVARGMENMPTGEFL